MEPNTLALICIVAFVLQYIGLYIKYKDYNFNKPKER